jgi:hypothetical protein
MLVLAWLDARNKEQGVEPALQAFVCLAPFAALTL